MWEARAAPGRGEELLAWALAAVATRPGPGAAEVYRSRGQGAEFVVVLLHLEPGTADREPGELLPPPPAELLAHPPRAWDFDRMSR